MEIMIDKTHIYYNQIGKGKDIVMLHGWGQNMEMMMPLANRLKDNFRITVIDLPGFGSSSEPQEGIDIYQYTELIDKFIKELKIKRPIMLGHSFGGRISICYASKNEVEKVVLLGAPCIRDRKPSKKELLLKKLKAIPGTKILVEMAKNYIGSTDYKNASPIMREVLVKTINEDLSECAKKIDVPTLLIWGTNDTAAPIESARKLETILKDGALIEIPNATHYAYLEYTDYIIKILNSFLGGNK